MKKIALSLAGVMVASLFATESSAVPVFARQTGRACSSCHYQHFPLLSSAGQDFKISGFTQVGTKGKFKTDDLSIPDNLNLAVFTTTYFQTQDAGKTAGVTNAVAVDKWGVPGTGGELSLFFGGRISEFAGFLAEAGLGGNQAVAAGGGTVAGPVGAMKLPMLFPVGDLRVGPVIFSSNGQGVAYSFELLNTGAANTHKLMGNSGPSGQHVKATSAAQYLGTNSAATGIAVVAASGMGFVNVAAYEMAGNGLVGGANNMNLTYIRAAGTMNAGGWDVGFGVQNWGGKSTVTNVEPKATVIDAQMQGDLGSMPVGFYASYGTAPAPAAGGLFANPFNPCNPTPAANVGACTSTKSATSFNVAGEFGVLPHLMTVQVALRKANTGAATSNGDNALMLGVVYELAQNVGLSFHHTQQSGSAWNEVGGTVPVGKTANTLLLEALF